MEYTTLGETGMSVSRLCLGTMGFGEPKRRDWVIGEETATAIIERAIDLGITFFDTANLYSFGESERILGNALAPYERDRMVVATKVYNEMDPENPNASGLSRKAVEQELANSLYRLGMETVDLYYIHRWDYDTSIEETMRVLDDVVRRGQVRYLGASSMWAHQLAEARHTSESLGLERFAVMQNHYNLVYREEEREMLPYCARHGMGVCPWSPLARGFLTRPHDQFEATPRGSEEADTHRHRHEPYRAGGGLEINERVAELAEEKGVSMAQIAIAWHLHTEPVTAPIVGVRSIEHLEDAVEALEISLSDSDLTYLEEPYRPKPVIGHE